MAATSFVRCSALAIGFAFGVAVVASAQTPEIEAELKKRLETLRAGQKLKQPKTDPKLPGKVVPSAPAMPDGAIGRLGASRLRHSAKPVCVTFSPDSKHVVSGGEDGMLRVWDIASGEPVSSLLSPDGMVRRVRYTHRGKQLAIQFSDSRIHFVDPATLKENSQFGADYGSDFALSDDGRMIAHFAANGMLRVTELDKNLEKLEVPAGASFQFHPNNRLLGVADAKGVVTLFMLAGGKPVLTIDNGGRVSSFSFSPDGKRLACGVGDIVKVWDIADGKTAKLFTDIKETGRVGEWLDNNRIGVCGVESAGVYDLDAKKWVGQVRGVAGDWAISPDGTKIASTGTSGLRVRIWELATGTQLHAENDAFPEPALLAPTTDGKSVFILAGENAFLWSIDKLTAPTVGKLPGKALVAAIGKGRLAVATPEAVHVYDDFDPRKPLADKPSRKLAELSAGCRAVAVSPDGKKVAYSGEENRIQIADAATGKLLRTLPIVTAGIALEFSPDSEKLAVIGRDGFLRLTPAKAGAEADFWKVRIQRGQRGSVAFSPDGKLIAASSSGLLKVANSSDGSEVFSTGGIFDNGLFQELAFSADGRLLIATSEGMTGGVRVWELATRSLVKRFSTGFGTVTRLGVFADSTRLVSAGAEETITAWDVTGRHGKDAPKADELLTAWANLGSHDASVGYPAMRVLVAGGAGNLWRLYFDEFAETRRQIADLIQKLSGDDADEQKKAADSLLMRGSRSLPALQEATKSDSAGLRKRAEEVLTKLAAKGVVVPEHGLVGDNLRFLRAAQVLEDIGTSDAIGWLRQIVEMGGPASEAAKAALKRLGKP